MINMKANAGAVIEGETLTYKADEHGIIRFVRTGDVDILRAAGAEPVIIPASKHLKVRPGQIIQFGGINHTANEHGVIHDVPHDQAVTLIRSGEAVEASYLGHAATAPQKPVQAPSEPETPSDPAAALDVAHEPSEAESDES